MSTLKSSAEDLTLNADGSENDIKFQCNGVEKASIDQDGVITATGGIITSSGTDVGGVIEITANSLTSGRVLNVVSNGMTTGNLANFYSNTADTGTRDLVRITNDNTAATGTTALKVTQDSTGLCADFVGDKIRVADGILFGTDTAAANALDDYEEGTWTPAVTGSSGAPSSVTYTTSPAGKYTRVGRVVTISFYLHVNTITGGSGHFQLNGVPFSSIGSNDGIGTGSVNLYAVDEPDLTDPTIYVDSTYIRVMCSTGGTGALDDNSWTTAALSSFNGSAVRGSITYQAT